MILSREMRFFADRIACAVLSAGLCIGLAAGCGPELTTPGDSDVSGTWFASGPAAGMTNITMVLTQTADGAITGTFTATGSPPQQDCPSTGPCDLASAVEGVNTVLQVNLELAEAGTFTGQVIDGQILRGTLAYRVVSPVEFGRLIDLQ